MPLHVVNTITSDPELKSFIKKVILTDDEIKALPTTAVELVPAPGAGKAIICPMIYNAGVCMFITNLAVGYSNITFGSQIQFAIGDGSAIDSQFGGGSNFETLLAAGNKMWAIASDYFQVSGQSSSVSELENKALNLAITQNTDGNFTGGDPANTIEITISYSIIDI
jgi:hypothetical protein